MVWSYRVLAVVLLLRRVSFARPWLFSRWLSVSSLYLTFSVRARVFHGAEGEARVFGEESARGVVLSRGLGSLWVCNEVALVLGPVVGLQAPPLSVAGAWVSCKSGLVVPLSTLCLCEPFSFSARSGDSLAQAGGDADA